MAEEPRQYWVRNDKGKTWGPLTFATIELLVSNGLIPGNVQASRDGLNFVYPGRLPDLRDAFPKELWGNSTEEVPDDLEGAVGGLGPKPGARPGPPVVLRGSSAGGIGGAVASASAQPPSASPATVAPASAPPAKAQRTAAPREGLGEGGAPTAGALGAGGVFHLYYLIASDKLTGSLVVTSEEVAYDLFFKKGAPEAVSSSRLEDDIGTFLVARGVLSAEQVEDARSLAPSFGGSLVNALFSLQIVNTGEVFKHLGEYVVGLLGKALATPGGSFVFDPSAHAPATAMPLGNPWVLALTALRAMPTEHIKARMGALLDHPAMKSGGKLGLDQLKLNTQESRVAASLDGVRSPSALCDALPAEADAILRTVYLLWCCEIVAFVGGAHPSMPAAETSAPASPVEPEAPPSPAPAPEVSRLEPRPTPVPAGSPARRPIPASPTPAPTGAQGAVRPAATRPAVAAMPPPVIGGAAPRSAQGGGPPRAGGPARPVGPVRPAGAPPVLKPPVIGPSGAKPGVGGPPVAKGPELPGDDLSKLEAFRLALKGKNHFEVLELGKEAAPAQIKAAYFRFAKGFHPDTVGPDAPPEAAKLKADIFALVGEAYRVLGDDAQRADYLAGLLENGAAAESVDAARIFAAEEAFQKGCILVRARKFEEAVKQLGQAVELNDKEGEFLGWFAWSRFLAAKDKAAVKDSALKDLQAAIRMNPKCAASYYFVGQITKLLGDTVTAQKWFKKAVSEDPNHTDAQRELRLASAQK